MVRIAPIFTFLALLSLGCTHAQLRRSTLAQGATLSDIQIQQVLDNLAMQAAKADALPYFALSSSGSAQVSDGGSASPSLEWDATTIVRETLGFDASRQVTEQWSLVAVLDPDRLFLMQCAYRAVLQRSDEKCFECFDELQAFFGPRFDPDCQLPSGWFCVGRKREVPSHASYVGHHGSTYVWVSGSGIGDLSRFTRTILDIATMLPYAPPTKTVVTRKDSKGNVIEIEETETKPLDPKSGGRKYAANGTDGARGSAPVLPQRLIPLVSPSIQYVPTLP